MRKEKAKSLDRQITRFVFQYSTKGINFNMKKTRCIRGNKSCDSLNKTFGGQKSLQKLDKCVIPILSVQK